MVFAAILLWCLATARLWLQRRQGPHSYHPSRDEVCVFWGGGIVFEGGGGGGVQQHPVGGCEGSPGGGGAARDGICCNITLVFGYCQAVAAAQAGATLISPFPGRGEGFSGGGGTEAVCECVCVWLRHRQGRHFTLTGGRGGVSFLGGGVRGTLISPFPGRGEGGRSFVIMSSMQVV